MWRIRDKWLTYTEDQGGGLFLVLEVSERGRNDVVAIEWERVVSRICRVKVHLDEVCGNLKGLENSREKKKTTYLPVFRIKFYSE